MIILMGIALTILCICSVMELALLLFLLLKSSKHVPLVDRSLSNPKNAQSSSAEPVTDAGETMDKARRRYEEELLAFQDLLNYNADVAYGVDTMKSEE